MKTITFLILFLNFIFTFNSYSQTVDERIKSIDSLRDIIASKELKLNHILFDNLIEQYQNENKVLPTAQITLALAQKNDNIKFLREKFEALNDQLLSILLKDSLFNAVHNDFMIRRLYSTSYYNEVKNKTQKNLSSSKKGYDLLNKHYNALVLSNLEALKIYVKEHKENGKYINYPIHEQIKGEMLSHPEAKKISDEIGFIQRIIKIKEQQIVNM